ncbi:MAG: AraC family transcriptional regulator [Ruminococcaceae bacterium]|nr:AraC family transcriptional regulator [Oscillospiraceae bacterium]
MFLLVENSEQAKRLLPIYMLTAGVDFVQPPARRPNGAPLHQILFVDRGAIRVRCGKGEFLLKQGNAIFMQKGYPIFYERAGEESRTGWISFDGEGVEPLLRYFNAEPFSCQSDAPVKELRRTCTKAVEHKAPSELLSRLVYDLVITYFQSLRAEKKSSALRAAKAYVEERYRDDLSVSDMAAAAGISPSLLYRLFRGEQGCTPVEYLRAVRLGHAKRLLLEAPQMPIARIATACGFADTAYFCKVFRDREHMTPGGYRSLYMS